MFEKLLLAVSCWIMPVADLPSAASTPPALASVAVGLDSWVRPEVWSVPVYVATERDARQPLLYNADAWSKVAAGRWRRYGNSPAVEDEILASSSAAFPYRGNVFSSVSTSAWQLPAGFRGAGHAGPEPLRFHLGAGMTPAPGPDGHMVVGQPDGRVLETYAGIRLSTGALIALSYAVSDPRGRGDGAEGGQTASMLPVYLGLLDDDSLATGVISHALAITVPARLLAPAAVYPALAFDRGALTEVPPYAGSLPMGARLALPAATDIEALGLATTEGRVIATTARRHGFFIVDRGGAGISLRVLRNPGAPNPRLRHWDAALRDDLQKIFARLVVAPS